MERDVGSFHSSETALRVRTIGETDDWSGFCHIVNLEKHFRGLCQCHCKEDLVLTSQFALLNWLCSFDTHNFLFFPFSVGQRHVSRDGCGCQFPSSVSTRARLKKHGVCGCHFYSD